MIYTFIVEGARGQERWVKTYARHEDAHAAAVRLTRAGASRVVVRRGQDEVFRIGEADGTKLSGEG